MVSIVLLTTEEVLQRNGFWYCLDTIWITQEMEPFEDVKPEHVYSKPLSRDIYYTKFPDIPRSESEDENSLTVKGFINKHQEWKSKICIRKLDSQRNSMQSTCSIKSDCVSNNRSNSEVPKRVSSVDFKTSELDFPKLIVDNDERVQNFFKNLLQSIPPPPLEHLPNTDSSIKQPENLQSEICDIDLPDYSDFENDCIVHANEEQMFGPLTSTLKKSNVKSYLSVHSFKTENSDQFEWYETIYGVSELMDYKETRELTNSTHRVVTESEDFISWSEIVDMCGAAESILKNNETVESENIISQSHYVNSSISEISDSDDEGAYAKFAINKLRQSLKNKECIPDSSSMENLNCENEEIIKSRFLQNDPSLFETFYRLAPGEEDLVNV